MEIFVWLVLIFMGKFVLIKFNIFILYLIFFRVWDNKKGWIVFFYLFVLLLDKLLVIIEIFIKFLIF